MSEQRRKRNQESQSDSSLSASRKKLLIYAAIVALLLGFVLIPAGQKGGGHLTMGEAMQRAKVRAQPDGVIYSFTKCGSGIGYGVGSQEIAAWERSQHGRCSR